MASGEADKLLIKTLAVKKLTLRNKLNNSSILFARVFKKAQVVFSAISLPEKNCEGRRRPIMRYVVWLLVPLQGQKEAVSERGLGFFNNQLAYNLETNIIYKRQNVDYNLTLCEMTMIYSPIFYVYLTP